MDNVSTYSSVQLTTRNMTGQAVRVTNGIGWYRSRSSDCSIQFNQIDTDLNACVTERDKRNVIFSKFYRISIKRTIDPSAYGKKESENWRIPKYMFRSTLDVQIRFLINLYIVKPGEQIKKEIKKMNEKKPKHTRINKNKNKYKIKLGDEYYR